MNVQEEIPKLLPNLGALQSVMTMNSLVSLESYRKAAYGLEQLPYCVGGTLAALDKATVRQEDAIRAIDLRTVSANTDYVLPVEERNQIAYEVDAFFESAVRTQNGLWPYLQYRHKRSVPPSFRKLVEQIAAGSLTWGATIDGAIMQYWAESGQRVRAYRDLSQHHVVLASDAHVVITEGVVESFFMPLPTNPKTKKPLDLVYNNESPNAIPYITDAFIELARFLRAVIFEILGYDAREPKSVSAAMFKEGEVGPPMRTGAIVTAATLRQRLDKLIDNK